MMSKAALATALVLVVPGPAHAESFQTTVQSFGLPGIWSMDCAKPPELFNEHMTVSISGSTVRVRRAFGRAVADNLNTLRDAKLIAPDKLFVREQWGVKVVEFVYLKADGKIRAWSTTHIGEADGGLRVKDGVSVGPASSGRSTPWFTRCGS
jgi:hypothetical protein